METIEHIPDRYLVEIGRVSVKWSLLESMVDLCLMRLADKDILEPRSAIIFNHMAFPMKMDVMGAMVSELLPAYPGLAGFPDVQGLLRKAQKRRNFVIHGKWGLEEATGKVQVSSLSARGKLKTSITSISAKEIRAIADLISEASQALYSLVVKAGTANDTPSQQ